MSLESTNKISILKERARMFQKARDFFSKREILEVDVPVMTQKAPIDLHIDLVKGSCMGQTCYLQSSPEYGMKRLLSMGIGDIYQLSHVFRDHEKGERHNPEFVMVEWYKIGVTFEAMIEETLDFLRLFLPLKKVEILSYDEMFKKYGKHDVEESVDFAINIEPKLGDGCFTVIKDFPHEQAALARVEEKNDKFIAMRFEIFHKGYELANGYKELTDAREQRKRLIDANRKRKALNKEEYPIDEYFLEALEKGLPDMCGVAVGFDRLMMLKCKTTNINDVIPFGWENT